MFLLNNVSVAGVCYVLFDACFAVEYGMPSCVLLLSLCVVSLLCSVVFCVCF